MTLMKSILLGSAAGIVAVAGAQAADLPTKKSAPAEYVRVCNVGGMAGFIIPGSDTCLKITGYVTAQVEAGNVKQAYAYSFAPGSSSVGLGPTKDARNTFGWTTRANLTMDARQDTAYGVLRGYFEIQAEFGSGYDTDGSGTYINRAYIQWAGITAGKANSFFSFFGGGEGWANMFSPDRQGFNQPDLMAYTATFGGGFSATLSFESAGNGTSQGDGGATGSNVPFLYGTTNWTNLGTEAPDIVVSLDANQAWGSAHVAGVAHQVRAISAPFTNAAGNGEQDTLNKWGWAIDGGVKFNLPSFGAGDNVSLQGVWTRNAIWYSGIPDGMWGENGQVNGNGLPMPIGDTWSNGDGTWATPTAWSIGATLEHHFSPVFSLDPEVSYAEVHWSGLPGNVIGTLGTGTVIPKDSESWIVGAIAHWDPVPHLDFAFELMYQSTHTSTPLGTTLVAPVTSFPNHTDGFEGRFYITRDF